MLAWGPKLLGRVGGATSPVVSSMPLLLIRLRRQTLVYGVRVIVDIIPLWVCPRVPRGAWRILEHASCVRGRPLEGMKELVANVVRTDKRVDSCTVLC